MPLLDHTIIVLSKTHMFVAGITALILDNSIPGTTVCNNASKHRYFIKPTSHTIVIDRVAGAIIRLVASMCPSVCLFALSCLSRLTFDLDFWHEGPP